MCETIIDRIGINNYKCHLNTDVELGKLTIIAGENSVGKSSLIQALLLYYTALDKNSVFTYNVFSNNLGPASELISENSEDQFIKVSVKTNDGNESFVKLGLDDDTDTLLIRLNNVDPQNKMSLFYLNAERIGPRLFYYISTNNDKYVGAHGENTVYVMNQMDKAMRSAKTNCLPKELCISEITRFSANCEKWLELIVPGVCFTSSVNTDQGTATIKFKRDGDSFYSPTSTGFGVSYALPIIVQALTASMIKNSVLVVENPEAHLHPLGQSNMGKFLAHVATSGTQVIIETHSDHVINGCRLELAKENKYQDGRIVFFSRKESSISHDILTIDKTGNISSWPESFMDQEKKDITELLRLRL